MGTSGDKNRKEDGIMERGNPGVAGIGYIVNAWIGVIYASMEKPIEEATNNMVELKVVIEGLLLYKEMGIKKLAIEGDFMIVINALRTSQSQNWKLNSKLGRALDLSNPFEEVMINHIYKEGNLEADNLVNLGADGNCIKDIGG
ncbi:uncharacterized protein LOC131028678 [Cryptomeria japonica]|uniref:uncharacterized protein LOC131028678 n=1 Tax=Cryptomeria japonica TaxID=3369 RepID=UPI0027DAB170|nr:uncharacterized protein LOC131028678 [Cryptomeria japonica]